MSVAISQCGDIHLAIIKANALSPIGDVSASFHLLYYCGLCVTLAGRPSSIRSF